MIVKNYWERLPMWVKIKSMTIILNNKLHWKMRLTLIRILRLVQVQQLIQVQVILMYLQICLHNKHIHNNSRLVDRHNLLQSKCKWCSNRCYINSKWSSNISNNLCYNNNSWVAISLLNNNKHYSINNSN